MITKLTLSPKHLPARISASLLNFLLLFSLHSQSPLIDLKKGLVAHYTFSSNFLDLSGNGWKLSTNGSVRLGMDRFGKNGDALQFDDDISSAALDVNVSDKSFTLAAWFFKSAESRGFGGFYQNDVDAAGQSLRVILDFFSPLLTPKPIAVR